MYAVRSSHMFVSLPVLSTEYLKIFDNENSEGHIKLKRIEESSSYQRERAKKNKKDTV